MAYTMTYGNSLSVPTTTTLSKFDDVWKQCCCNANFRKQKVISSVNNHIGAGEGKADDMYATEVN